MQDVVNKLISLLDVQENSTDVFVGESHDLGNSRVFGGQVLGQALVAVSRTVDSSLPHSLHAYFLRPGNPKIPIRYEVDRIRDGKSFKTRRAVAHQEDEAIFNLAASFHRPEDGLEHQVPSPQVISYEGLESELERARKVVDKIPPHLQNKYTRPRPIEVRAIEPVDYFHPQRRQPKFQVWLRATASLPDDPIIHRCFLAYASDFNLLEPCLFPHGMSFLNPNLQVASLDHAMWFHRDFRMDDWILYEVESPTSGHSRGFGRGQFFDQSGRLIASTCQEGLMRLRS